MKLKWTLERHFVRDGYFSGAFKILRYTNSCHVYCGGIYLAKTKTIRAAKRLCQDIADAIERAEK
jgi:hypothetical protein